MKNLCWIFLLVLGAQNTNAAEDVKCEIKSINYKDTYHLALYISQKVTILRDQGAAIGSHSNIDVFAYWPDMHYHGIKYIKQTLETSKCNINPSDIRCELTTNGEDLVFIRSNTNSEFHRILNMPNEDMEKVRIDFISTGLCH